MNKRELQIAAAIRAAKIRNAAGDSNANHLAALQAQSRKKDGAGK